ncbi:hypothetical protein COLO4_30462 [Corchorus olitorius]|uniref:Uncharacterized protein n=1 Tax=Corchorus olitorius TaxID=93759 RepID=A0A1R3H8S0_9ROSI|nr:hypothetical protein COLO4_30462 [Corchorus olitorius]
MTSILSLDRSLGIYRSRLFTSKQINVNGDGCVLSVDKELREYSEDYEAEEYLDDEVCCLMNLRFKEMCEGNIENVDENLRHFQSHFESFSEYKDFVKDHYVSWTGEKFELFILALRVHLIKSADAFEAFKNHFEKIDFKWKDRMDREIFSDEVVGELCRVVYDYTPEGQTKLHFIDDAEDLVKYLRNVFNHHFLTEGTEAASKKSQYLLLRCS